jgi:hypothetical protein
MEFWNMVPPTIVEMDSAMLRMKDNVAVAVATFSCCGCEDPTLVYAAGPRHHEQTYLDLALHCDEWCLEENSRSGATNHKQSYCLCSAGVYIERDEQTEPKNQQECTNPHNLAEAAGSVNQDACENT